MVAYPYYAIGSTSLNDASGRWNEQRETTALPRFPGVESTVITMPGVPGNIPGPIASNMASTESLVLYVWATVGGVIPDDFDDRMSALATNLDQLYRVIQGAAAAYGSGASVPLTRHYAADDSRTAYGRFEASSDPVRDESANFATVTLLFTIPSGTWRKAEVTTAQLTPSTTALTDLAGSTGPIPDSKILILGPCNSATVTNSGGVGFKLNLPLASGEWTVVDAATWRYRAPSTGTPNIASPATLSAAIESYGPPLGSALVLVPNASTVPINVTMPGATSASRFQVRARPAYF